MDISGGEESNATDATLTFGITPAAQQITRKMDCCISARDVIRLTPGGGALFYATRGGANLLPAKTQFTTNAFRASLGFRF